MGVRVGGVWGWWRERKWRRGRWALSLCVRRRGQLTAEKEAEASWLGSYSAGGDSLYTAVQSGGEEEGERKGQVVTTVTCTGAWTEGRVGYGSHRRAFVTETNSAYHYCPCCCFSFPLFTSLLDRMRTKEEMDLDTKLREIGYWSVSSAPPPLPPTPTHPPTRSLSPFLFLTLFDSHARTRTRTHARSLTHVFVAVSVSL